MRIFLIKSAGKKRRPLTAYRLRSAAATALTLLLVLTLAVALRDGTGDSVPASADSADLIVYAISYCGTDNQQLEMLKHDIEYMRVLGLEFTLPDRISDLKSNGVILILEGTADLEAALSVLGEYAVPAVVIPPEDPDAETKARLLRLEDEGSIALASYVDSVDGPWELAASIGEASMAFASRFGRPCSVFVHECKGVVCSGCFSGAGELFKAMTVFLFGNGMNVIPCGEKPFILNRIMRLPDWTIESYFSDIAK